MALILVIGSFLPILIVNVIYFFTEECQELRRRICVHCAAKPETALSLLRQAPGRETTSWTGHGNGHETEARNHIVPSGIPALDRQLNGGFRVGNVTEIYGSAGTGKTQLAMHLCVAAATNLGLASAYIETEEKFSMERLAEIAAAKSGCPFRSTSRPKTDAETNYILETPEQRQRFHQIMSQILIYDSANSADKLKNVLSAVEIEACARYDSNHDDDGYTARQAPLGVIVLDSIASPARRDFGKGDVASRAQFLMECANTLKRLAETLNLAVVVINHIGGTAFHNDNADVTDQALDATGALGNSWHHCATTRLLIENKNQANAVQVLQLRKVIVSKSSMLKRGTAALVCMDRYGFHDALDYSYNATE